MIHDNRYPMAKGPLLGQGKRKPRTPEADASWHNSEINEPDMIRIFGRDDVSRYFAFSRCFRHRWTGFSFSIRPTVVALT